MSVRLANFAILLGAALGQMIKSTVGDGIDISIAIPDVDEGPFDILVKIAAPKGTGWAAVAWGGEMLRNPLSVAWPNAGGTIVSSRLATGYALPLAYDGATVTVLKSSESGEDGWTASFICKGCSEWDGGSLDPGGENEFAWAFSTRAPFTPASVDSIFPYHTDKDHFSVDLSKAKLSDKEWDALVEELDTAAEDSEDTDGPEDGAEDKGEEDDHKPVDVDDSVEVIVDEPDDEETGEIKPDKPVQAPEEKTSIDKPIVQTSVIILTPPAATDVDEPTAVDSSDRDGRIPRPTFMPIPEPGDDDKAPEEPKEPEDPNRIPRPTFIPAPEPGDDNKTPDEPIAPEDPNKIPRPTFLPSPSGGGDDNSPPSTLVTSTVRTIPRPSPMPMPDTPIGDDDGDYWDDHDYNPPSATVTRTVIPVQPRPTITETVTAIPTPPWGTGPPPWAGRGRGGGRGGLVPPRGRGRGRGG